MSFKDAWFNKVFTLRNLFIGGNFLLLVLLVAAVVKDTLRPWKPIQREYFRREVARLHDALEKASTDDDKERLTRELSAMRRQSVKIRQIMLPRMDRYDRCLTCHT